MSEERAIGEAEDPDFGRLVLWEDRSEGGPIGGPTREIVVLTWRGRFKGVSLNIDTETTSIDVLLGLREDLRANVLSLPSRHRELRAQVAHQIIDRARDWSNDPHLTEKKLASSLFLDGISIEDTTSIIAWFEVTAGPLLDFTVQASVDDAGDIADASLLG